MKALSTLARASAALAVALAAGATQAAVVDFESVTSDQFAGVINADGYQWTFSAAGWFIGPATVAFCPSCTTNGTSRLVAAGDRGDTARVTMTDLGGAAFDLASFDAATANSTETNIIDVLGTYAAGGTVSASFAIDGSFDGYSLSGFTGLSSVVFSSRISGSYNFGGFSIDNLSSTGTAVSAPGSLALSGLALLALGGVARRRGAAR